MTIVKSIDIVNAYAHDLSEIPPKCIAKGHMAKRMTGISTSLVSVFTMCKKKKNQYILLNFKAALFYFFALLSEIWYHGQTETTKLISMLM